MTVTVEETFTGTDIATWTIVGPVSAGDVMLLTVSGPHTVTRVAVNGVTVTPKFEWRTDAIGPSASTSWVLADLPASATEALIEVSPPFHTSSFVAFYRISGEAGVLPYGYGNDWMTGDGVTEISIDPPETIDDGRLFATILLADNDSSISPTGWTTTLSGAFVTWSSASIHRAEPAGSYPPENVDYVPGVDVVALTSYLQLYEPGTRIQQAYAYALPQGILLRSPGHAEAPATVDPFLPPAPDMPANPTPPELPQPPWVPQPGAPYRSR